MEVKMDAKATITFEDFSKLDLRIATVLHAEPHPNADRLLKLQVDLGDEQRQICAGLKQFVDPAELVGKQIVVVVNLAPRTMRGEESNGMLLAAIVAEDDQLKDVILVTTVKPVAPGSSVS